ncbi:putative leucine-rich repeat-containing protein DDB_G0290503 [Galendromus occidentalis]|uniref:Leucine-rich repeat-containing protein DDB_G0290503 n=1 Tax=Galendromus occidentalis TaxID=34638 RepID=A0AAJ6VZP0_9ACAR|nr:putative leucine-rich repeat-containing protein DDB_G0290503 [Galendromus occidentalis]
MDEQQNSMFESTRIKTPKSSKNALGETHVESIRQDLENSLTIEGKEESASPPKSVALRDKLSGLNSKLSSYVVDAKKTESRLAESLRKCRVLEEANTALKEDSRQQIEFLRSQLDEQIRKTVLAEEQRYGAEQRLEQSLKLSNQTKSELESCKKRAEELEDSLNAERRGSKATLAELVELREQRLQERTEYNELKQQMVKLKIEHAELQERFKISSAELTMNQTKLGEFQKQIQYTADEVKVKLAEQMQRLEKKFSDQMSDKLRERQTEIANLKAEIQNKLDKIQQMSARIRDFELLRIQLDEQRKRAEAAESEATEWRQKLVESENRLQQRECEYAKHSEHERRRREKLNRKLLTQARTQDEVRQELETYRRLIEHLDQGGLAECFNISSQETAAASPSSPKSPLGRRHLHGAALNSPDARSMLLRKALTPRKRSLSGDSDSLMKILNTGRRQAHES